MTSIQRWGIFAVVIVAIVAITTAVRSRPVSGAQITSAKLLALIEAGQDAPYSGYAETRGALALPVTDRFTDVGSLFGETTKLRVWWRSPQQWRVDKLTTAGETDLIRRDDTTTEWHYEKAKATSYIDPDIRLPRTADLLPPELAKRVLREIDNAEIKPLPGRRIAGRTADGLRVYTASEAASIDHVDLWADVDSGITLRAEVYDAATATPVFVSGFRQFSATKPSRERTSFSPPSGARIATEDVLDIADAANQFSEAVPPPRLAGLALSPRSDRAVGVYGEGITQFIAIPLWDRAAVPLRKQLGTSPNSRSTNIGGDGSTVLSAGPLGVLLTEQPGGDGWLLAGTVNEETLLKAAKALETNPVQVGG